MEDNKKKKKGSATQIFSDPATSIGMFNAMMGNGGMITEDVSEEQEVSKKVSFDDFKKLFNRLQQLIKLSSSNDNIDIDEEANLVAEMEGILPFKDDKEHSDWLNIMSSYETFDDFKDMTLNIADRLKECKVKESKELKEAPDDMGYFTDDEIEAQERAEFEKRLAQRKAQRDKAKQQELDDLEQEKAKQKAIEDAKEKGKEIYDKVKDADLEDWYEYLVPSSGKCDTVAGEILRAFMKIDYRCYNDGDKFYEGYGRETCGSPATYLYKTTNDDIADFLVNMVEGGDYKSQLVELSNLIREYLLNSPELFGTLNTKDMYDYDIDKVSDFDEPRDYTLEVYTRDYINQDLGISLYDFINNGDLDSFDFIDRLSEDAGAEINSYGGVDVDTPWSHSDDNYTINNLTKDEYEILKNFLSREDYFDSYIEELYNKYGDPNEEDNSEE